MDANGWILIRKMPILSAFRALPLLGSTGLCTHWPKKTCPLEKGAKPKIDSKNFNRRWTGVKKRVVDPASTKFETRWVQYGSIQCAIEHWSRQNPGIHRVNPNCTCAYSLFLFGESALLECTYLRSPPLCACIYVYNAVLSTQILPSFQFSLSPPFSFYFNHASPFS